MSSIYGYEWDTDECVVCVRYPMFTKKSQLIKRALPCYADNVNEQLEAVWNGQAVLGRTGDLYSYTGARDVRYSFNFDLHREMQEPGKTSPIAVPGEYIDELIKVIKTSIYPKGEVAEFQPPTTLWKFGDFLMSGIVNSATFDWKTPVVDRAYSVCTVSINMTGIVDKIITANQLKDSSLFSVRGTSSVDDVSTSFFI